MAEEAGLPLYLWTVILGGFLLVLYYIATDFVKDRSSETSLRKFAVSLNDGAAAEAARDFSRTVKAVEVFDGEARLKLESLLLRKGEAEEEKAFDLLLSHLKDKGYDKADALAERVASCLCVNLSMQVLEHAKVSPPAMYQPRFTLALLETEVFVVAHAFVGMPVLGPAHPEKKYTRTQLSYMTSNLLETAATHEVSYKVKPTNKATMGNEELQI